MFFYLLIGFALAIPLTLLFGVYSIGPAERAVLTTFGRVQRTTGTIADDPVLGALLTDEEKSRYNYPTSGSSSRAGPTSSGPGSGCTG